MQKRTTNYSFQKFGDVFYSVNHNAGHLVDYVENDFKITNKTFDSFYYSSDPVYLDMRSGIIMLVVSKDGKKAISNSDMTIQEFLIQAINKGSDDTGKVHMQVEYNGATYYGFSANTDIIAASVEAFVDAINKFIVD